MESNLMAAWSDTCCARMATPACWHIPPRRSWGPELGALLDPGALMGEESGNSPKKRHRNWIAFQHRTIDNLHKEGTTWNAKVSKYVVRVVQSTSSLCFGRIVRLTSCPRNITRLLFFASPLGIRICWAVAYSPALSRWLPAPERRRSSI